MHIHYLIPVFLICACSVAMGLKPLMSSPDNGTILVIIDVHRNHDNSGTCTDPNWGNLELANSVWYSHVNSGSDVGIEVYDGCTSTDQTLAILRDRLFSTPTPDRNHSTVASVVTLVDPEVNDAISGVVMMSDAFLVTVGSHQQSMERKVSHSGQISIDLSPRVTMEILRSLLRKLRWTYMTTISDDSPASTWEHRHFLATKDDTTCVQESIFNISNSSSFDFSDIKSNGVVIFTQNVGDTKSVISALPPTVSVVVVSNEKPTGPVVGLDHNVIVLADSFKPLGQFVTFMSEELPQMTSSGLLLDYYESKFNCSLNVTASALVCPDTQNMAAYFNIKGSTERLNMASSVVDAVSRAVAKANEGGCSTFKAPGCFDVAEFESVFKRTEMGYLVPKAIFNASLSWIKDGSIQPSQTILQSETVSYDPQMDMFIRSLNDTFPQSHCPDWCPACQQDGCHDGGQVAFGGDYLFTPGDIIIAGMFPFTRHLEMSKDIACSGYSIHGNTDILGEAFLYAIQTFHARYSGVLPNVTIGSVLFDTCSDDARASQIMMNFETCKYMFRNSERVSSDLVPSMVPAYITYQYPDQRTFSIENNQKLQLSVSEDGNVYKNDMTLFDKSMFNYKAIVDVLRQMEWTHVGLITSQSTRMDLDMDAFFELAKNNSICISNEFDISGVYKNVLDTVNSIRQSSGVGVYVIFADSDDVDRFFRVPRSVTKTWIVVETRQNWLDLTSVILPSGSLLLQRAGRINNDFDTVIQTKIDNHLVTAASESWLDEFKTSRDTCTNCDLPSRVADIETKMRASDVIRTVDVTLHALDIARRSTCNNSSGPCRALYTDGFRQVPGKMNEVMFDYQGEDIDLADGYQVDSYRIINMQSSRIVEIGEWTRRQLTLDKSQYKAYDSSENEIKDGRQSVCHSRCQCLNAGNITGPGVVEDPIAAKILDPDMGYKNSSGKFNSALWSIIVVIIAGSGAFATLCLMLYIMVKVCSGALVRRYLVLGLMLLVAMIFLFMSVLPFVFTPSEAVCGMRYFAHGVSYALCFAIILTKMTTLRDYKYIGLGGEISRINQLLSVLFITGVQIAVGVEWWVLRAPVVYEETNSTIRGEDSIIPKTHYACDFKRGDFLAYHSYVIFLIAVCCLYAICVRKETKNMKEARLLLIASWFCLAIWIALIVTISVMDREYIEAICSIGILANALTLMMVIYFPKLTAISRLKYEVSDQRKARENGYKVDTDFQFERPYSLPGTLHSSVTDKSLSYPRSLAAFDTSLSY